MANFSKPQSVTTMLFAFLALLQFTAAFGHGNLGADANIGHDGKLLDTGKLDLHFRRHVDELSYELTKRQQESGILAITGVCDAGTNSAGVCNNGRSSAPRLEIRTLQQNAEQWNLYLLAMEKFQAKDKNDRLSYYAVVGVHGRPFVSWNNFPTPLLNRAGFCPHSNVLFGTWHRPYLAIFEQALYQAMLEVIDEFPTSQQGRLKQAAATFRMPYWDWAMDPGRGGAAVPTAIRDQTVMVNKPNGRVRIPNPLYSYSWGESLPSEMGGGPWNSFPNTLRRPVANPTRSNNNEMNARFNSMRISLRDRVFALFSSKQPWGAASTTQIGVRTDVSGRDSFESVHDAIHNTAGGETGGHMYYLDISSFDPIFWLHHTNIDRLMAMYQHIVPNTYVSNGNVNRPMAQWNQGEPKDAGSPLKPFTKDNRGNYFTSLDVKETRVLGYYYPETSERSYSQVAQAVTRLYGAGGRRITKRGATSDGSGYVEEIEDEDEEPEQSSGQYPGRPFKEGDYHHVLNVVADKYAIKGSYTVHCFIGKPRNNATNSTGSTEGYSAPPPYPTPSSKVTIDLPLVNITIGGGSNCTEVPDGSHVSTEAPYDPSTDYTQDPNYVGAYGVLGHMEMATGNGSDPTMTDGTLPLTSCLQGKEASGELESLHPEHVEPYLAKHLYYKIVTADGEISADDIPNLHISASCTKAKPATSENELPDLSAPYIEMPGATKDKPAGKPFVYKPTPLDIALPDKPTQGYQGLLPHSEEGYCKSVQTIEYVDMDGNFLYSEM